MRKAALVPLLLLVGSCGGGGGGGDEASQFFLVEFLESGTNAIPRNRALKFRFSAPVAISQDFFERLKIVNGGPENFSLAMGAYFVNGDEVTFLPRLPEKEDRSDGGLRENASYHVFLKGGADALRSAGGEPIVQPQELFFDTSAFFEDPVPTEPPRGLRLLARDPTTNQTIDLSRADPRPGELAALDSNELLQQGRALDPGAGGAPSYGTPWAFELHVSEPLDPATVTADMVQLLEIRRNALTGTTTADPGHVGDPVSFKVPILVELVQRPDSDGELQLFIRAQAVQTLVDDARYRLSFSGGILGIDYRKTYTGDNGVTGDGETTLSGSGVYAEPGGLGYTTEFLVYDRPAITASRTVTYDPLADGIEPETGQTTTDPNLFNAALYNPTSAPGTAVGKVSDFGDGSDGDLAVSGGSIFVIDTGDVPNGPSGISIVVTDLDYLDSYSNAGTPASGQRTVAGREPMKFQLENLTVSASSTLRIKGVNPVRMLVRGLAQISGTVDAGGSAGANGSSTISQPGVGGPGGYPGGVSPRGDKSCPLYGGNDCSSYNGFLNLCLGAKNKYPFARKGEGPGRGNQGGDSYPYWAQFNSGGNVTSRDNTATGGGGGSHGSSGLPGEDRINAGGAIGTAGPSCSNYGTPNSSVIGARGVPGPVYGDRKALDWMGGSGGGGGGSVGEHSNAIGAYGTSGGAGGGGGGFFEIVAAGSIQVTSGGKISVAGGQGGAGFLEPNISPQYGMTYQSAWNTVTGGGGGGAGGTISLVSGGDISVVGGLLDARGGAGGIRGSHVLASSNAGANAGGDGGKGYIFLMDVDGSVVGLPGVVPAGEYDTFQYGVLTVSKFDLDRFGGISAITEMFGMPAADPDYLAMQELDILAHVNTGQSIRIFASSAKADSDNPLLPSIGTETALFEIALVQFSGGAATIDITGDMDNLNPAGGTPNRDAFTRVYASFEYNNEIDAATGPFASVDQVTVRFSFNG